MFQIKELVLGRRSTNRSGLSLRVRKNRNTRILGYSACLLYFVLTVMLLFPVYIKPEVTEATSKTATPSTLTFASTRSSATVHLDSINAVSGSFATSTQEQTASFSISTNNATGYTLNIKTTGDDTALTDNTNSNTSTNHLNTISDISTADNFAVNSWGLIPSKYNGSTNTTNYYPASSTGFTMDETNTANSTANDYTVGIGIKVNYDMKSATYSNDTLIAEYVANPVTYSIAYYSNTEDTVTDMPQTNPQTGTVSSPANPSPSQDITTTLASAPSRDGYTFLGWCAGNSAGTADTTNNTSVTNITTTDDVDSCSSTVYDADQSFGINATGSSPDTYYLYAMWAPEAPDLPCEAGYICYRGNGATAGTMPDQEVTTSTVMLTSSNFSRPGYGFAGWNTSSDGTGTNYGPAETITPGDLSSEGLKLYARWLAPTGVLQTWAGASNMNVGDVIALRDNRDNEVYTVAKLADNNIWITENLRLVPNTANITAKNTHNPTDTFLSAIPSSSSSTTQCSTDDSTCNDHVYFYTGNMDRTKTQSPINNSYDYAWYSYGTMYNWYTATAGNGTNSKNNGSVSGDICPSGWHLPTGGSSGEYASLSSALGGNSSTGATNIRKYPNNFIWSGDYNPSTQIPDGRGTQARIWSSTANSAAKSYRMGFNSSSITPAGTWNKWDNFAVRCIYQGGNLPYSAVTVDFEGTGINSLTFTSQGYDTETATPASPTVDLVEGVAYTVTANLTTGYEVSSWSTTTNGTLGNTTTTNPAVNPNTYTIAGDATLTVTGQITPTYTSTITFGEHITSISFSHPTYGIINITPGNSTDNGDGTYTNTATLYRGVEYTLSSSYEDGYTIHEWVAGANSTIGSTTSAATTYSVTGNTTLSLTAEETDELTYNLVYSAGSGTDAPDQATETSYQSTQDFTITNSAPIYYGYTFTGWSETPDANNNGTTVDYVSGDTITVASTGATTTKTLYPVYQAVSSCPSGKICYYENGADVINGGRGTMTNQSATSNSTANLIPTNYSKAGYGFAGWTTSENATPYGPNATITTPDLSSTGLALYAKWVKSSGTLQTWNSCNSLDTNGITALTDTRDNNTYAVAKLADNNCWIVENLRLDPSTANITNQNTHNPASGFATEAANSSTSNALCTTDDSSTCINQLQYNTNSLNRSLTQSYNAVSNSAGWYSYGVYYNWYTATAGNGTMETEANTNATGDICPSKWHLPTSTSSGEWAALNTAVNGGVSNADAGLRQYPVNLIWSGDYNGSSRTSGYGNGRYWAATGYDTNNAYRMGHQESGSKGSTPSGNFKKWDGFAVRCIYDGDIANPHDLVVTLPTGIESITLTNPTYGTQTATSQNNTVSLAENAVYTITANMTTGYELTSWTGGSNSTISDSSANPTTIRITDDTTLTATAQLIPSYTVNVTFDSHVTSIGFYNANYTNQQLTPQNSTDNGNGTYTGTVTLRKNVPYTVSPVFVTGYKFGSWSTTANGTLSTTTNPVTTYTVTDTATLTLTSIEKTGSTTLLPGQDLNAKMKTLAEQKSTSYNDNSFKIKALRMAGALPAGFVASAANTVSTSDSVYPIYIFFDNANDAGIMYFYTEASDIYMNADSSDAFSYNYSLTDLTGLENWDTSNVTDMSEMFYNASSLTDASAIDDWDIRAVRAKTGSTTSSSNNFYYMFYYAGGNYSNPVHPNFTKRSGTWNYVGTFIPGDTTSDTVTVTVTFDSHIRNVIVSGTTISTSGGTVSLTRGNSYTITATLDSGYELANWGPGEHGVINSNDLIRNSVYFIASANTTLTATSQVVPNDVTTTVNMDSHISKVTFRNSKYNNSNTGYVGMVTTSGGTITLKQGATYKVTASLANGYEVSSWTTVGGTVSNNAGTHTNFTPSGNSTITVSSATAAPTHTVTVNMDSNISYITFENSDWPTRVAVKNGSTVDLRDNTSYTVTAYTKTGYMLNSWSTTANGTLTSTTTNPTTYTVTDTATLTVTAQVTPSYTITVDFAGTGINSVSFSDGATTQTVTTNGDTVMLRQGVSYTITASISTGYILSTWSTTANGALTNTTTNPTTYTVSDTATLTVTSATISSITDLTYMQDFATLPSTTKANVLNSMILNQQYTLKDSRDQKEYHIAKLADGNVWMTQNLDHDIVTTAGYYTPQNTDIPSAWTPSTATYATGTTTWDTSTTGRTTPQSYDPGDLCWDGTTNVDYDGTLNNETTACGSDKHMHIGNYYDWTAAVAMNNSSSYTAGNTDVDQSICPAGWRLPIGGAANTGSKSFQYLWNQYSSSFDEKTMMNSPLYFSYAGYWYGYSGNVGSLGRYWSSVVSSSYYACVLGFEVDYGVYPRGVDDRSVGFSIRCVAR